MKDLIIKGFEKGVGQSPHVGFEEMNNLSADYAGVLTLNYALQADTNASKSNVAVTACSDANNTITVAANALGTETIVAATFSGTGTSGYGLSNGTYYWLKRQSSTVYKVYAAFDGAMDGNTPVEITSDTPGTSTITTSERPSANFVAVTANHNGRMFAVGGNSVWTRPSAAGSKWVMLYYSTTLTFSDIVYWKNYLIVFSRTHIGYYGTVTDENSFSGGSIISNFSWIASDWNLLSRVAILLQNDFIYYIRADASGVPVVGSFNQITGQVFLPTTPGTYNHATAAITAPSGASLTCLGESGANLLMGTINGIYSWDTTNSTFNLPVLRGSYINAMVSYANLAYAFVGEKNDLYATNGTVAQLIAKLPEHISANSVIIPHGVCVFNDKILFALRYNEGASYKIKVWSYDPNSKVFKVEYDPQGNISSDDYAAVYPISKTDFFVSAGTGYAMSLASRVFPTSYLGYAVSQIYQVGLPLSKTTFSQLEIIMDRVLVTGDGVRISYRTTANGSWTQFFTLSYATHGALQSFNTTFGISTELLQLKVEITSAGSTTTPYLKEIRLR